MTRYRIAAFGFRSLPPADGSAGADKFALELYPRLVKRGYEVVAYLRLYNGETRGGEYFENVKKIYLPTVSKSGFDSLVHSFKATCHIIFHNTADIVHIHNGGNSIWAVPLRLFGKKVLISQDGVDWKREKWRWYGRLFLFISSYITAHIPNSVIFDNIYSKELFEKKFHKNFYFIPYGSEVPATTDNIDILTEHDLVPQEYFLFVGRFIPDKGLHYLIEAYLKVQTGKKLVLVGGSPNPSQYEESIRSTVDSRVVFPGYVYGSDTYTLMKHAYCYIQPSDVEGLSPVILTVMGIGTPLLCSNIPENIFAVDDTAMTFEKSDVDDLALKITYALSHPAELRSLSQKAQQRATDKFSWETVVTEHIHVFNES